MKLSRRSLPIAAGAIALSANIITASAAHAEPESQIKSECAEAGGTYTTWTEYGHKYSLCCYKDIDGHKYCDGYQDGVYVQTCDAGTTNCASAMAPPDLTGPTGTPVQPPAAPPGGVMAPPQLNGPTGTPVQPRPAAPPGEMAP